jgi:hypothetical protein
MLWLWPDGTKEARHLALPDAAAWRRPVGMATLQGHLYVLDTGTAAGPGQVWRYAPGASGAYEAGRQPWVLGDPAFLRNATGLAADGDLWVSRDDGTIVRLVAGRTEPFAAARLDAPIARAAAVATAPGYRSLYVLDEGARRLVQLSKAGLFEGQVPDVARSGEAALGLWVDEGVGRAFVLTDRRLQEVPLPPPPAPAAAPPPAGR